METYQVFSRGALNNCMWEIWWRFGARFAPTGAHTIIERVVWCGPFVGPNSAEKGGI